MDLTIEPNGIATEFSSPSEETLYHCMVDDAGFVGIRRVPAAQLRVFDEKRRRKAAPVTILMPTGRDWYDPILSSDQYADLDSKRDNWDWNGDLNIGWNAEGHVINDRGREMQEFVWSNYGTGPQNSKESACNGFGEPESGHESSEGQKEDEARVDVHTSSSLEGSFERPRIHSSALSSLERSIPSAERNPELEPRNGEHRRELMEDLLRGSGPD